MNKPTGCFSGYLGLPKKKDAVCLTVKVHRKHLHRKHLHRKHQLLRGRASQDISPVRQLLPSMLCWLAVHPTSQ